jgi:hypothetical protein
VLNHHHDGLSLLNGTHPGLQVDLSTWRIAPFGEVLAGFDTRLDTPPISHRHHPVSRLARGPCAGARNRDQPAVTPEGLPAAWCPIPRPFPIRLLGDEAQRLQASRKQVRPATSAAL